MTESSREEVRVLFTLGKGRSGSTLLGSVLGGVEGFFNAGELQRFWEWGVQHGYSCACGVPVPECGVWGRVIEGLETSMDPVEAARLTRRVLGWRNLPSFLSVRRTESLRARWPGLARWAPIMGSLYRGVAESTGSRVVVDTTKEPLNPAALGLVEGVRPYVVHLVRDPRAVTYSWKRRKAWTDRPDEEMPRFGAAYSALSWLVRQGSTEVVRRRMSPARFVLLRYEDFVSDPRRWVGRLLEMVGEDGAATPFRGTATVDLAENHAMAGNPDRVGRRTVEIREDVEWRRRIRRRDVLVTTALTAPLLRRYGYSWSVT